MSKENIMKALKDKKGIYEAEEWKIVESFHGGDSNLEDYVENYRKNRKQIAWYNIIMKRIE